LREKQRAMIESLDLSKYAIDNASADWSTAETQVAKLKTQGKAGAATVVSVKSAVGAGLGQKRKAEGGGEEGGGKKHTRRGKKAKR